MTRSQQQAVSAVSSRCQCNRGAVARGVHFIREKEDRSLKPKDSAVVVSCHNDDVQGEQLALRTSYGIIQDTISTPVSVLTISWMIPFFSPHLFLIIQQYKQSIVAADLRTRKGNSYRHVLGL